MQGYAKIGFDLKRSGGQALRYRIAKEGPIDLWGYTGDSPLSDTECCEAVWAAFFASETAERLVPGERIYAAYENRTDGVRCTLGQKAHRTEECVLHIPACTWACFPLNRTDDAFVNEFYKTVLFGWLREGSRKRAEGLPNLEVYPCNMEEEGFEWEIRIPLER